MYLAYLHRTGCVETSVLPIVSLCVLCLCVTGPLEPVRMSYRWWCRGEYSHNRVSILSFKAFGEFPTVSVTVSSSYLQHLPVCVYVCVWTCWGVVNAGNQRKISLHKRAFLFSGFDFTSSHLWARFKPLCWWADFTVQSFYVLQIFLIRIWISNNRTHLIFWKSDRRRMTRTSLRLFNSFIPVFTQCSRGNHIMSLEQYFLVGCIKRFLMAPENGRLMWLKRKPMRLIKNSKVAWKPKHRAERC